MPSPESPGLRRWLEAIEAAHPAEIELGLERVAVVAERMGLLPAPMPVVLVGGTNGKGSTLAFLEESLARAGRVVGGYTSPHLFHFGERIRVGGVPAADPELVAAFEAVESAREGVSLTYFEFATLAAMAHFTRRGAEIVLLEVGLGGRLDAVNIWDPLVSVITSIDLDHAEFLGGDRESVGVEKAGILRPGGAAVCGDPDPPASLFRPGADLWALGRDFAAVPEGDTRWRWQGPPGVLGPLPMPAMSGDYQLRNAATAVAAGQRLPASLRPDEKAWREGLGRAVITGRGQCLDGPVPVWLDVAHNPGAAAEFAALLETRPCEGRTLAVYGAMRDKDVEGVARAMAGVVDRWYPCGMSQARGLSGDEAAARLDPDPARLAGPFPDPGKALAAARRDARPGGDRILAFGSFMVVTAALAALDPGAEGAAAASAPASGVSDDGLGWRSGE